MSSLSSATARSRQRSPHRDGYLQHTASPCRSSFFLHPAKILWVQKRSCPTRLGSVPRGRIRTFFLRSDSAVPQIDPPREHASAVFDTHWPEPCRSHDDEVKDAEPLRRPWTWTTTTVTQSGQLPVYIMAVEDKDGGARGHAQDDKGIPQLAFIGEARSLDVEERLA